MIRIMLRVFAIVAWASCHAYAGGVVARSDAPDDVGSVTFDPAGGLFLSSGSAPRSLAAPVDDSIPVVESQATIEIVMGGASGLRFSGLAISNVPGRAPGVLASSANGVDAAGANAAGEEMIAVAAGDSGSRQTNTRTGPAAALPTTLDLSVRAGPAASPKVASNLRLGSSFAEPRSLMGAPGDNFRMQEDSQPSASKKAKRSLPGQGSAVDPLAAGVAIALVLVYVCLIWNMR
jgi:hypothetical protein